MHVQTECMCFQIKIVITVHRVEAYSVGANSVGDNNVGENHEGGNSVEDNRVMSSLSSKVQPRQP